MWSLINLKSIKVKISKKLDTFNESNIPSLDEVLLWALELFQTKKINKLNLSWFKKPLIAGSWNAIATARIIFSNKNVIFCDASNFNELINNDIDWLIIMSASWEKHAETFANIAIKKWIKTKLVTCNNNSTTQAIIWKENVVVTPKNREPYTYNTSTYLWWILAITWESAFSVQTYIQDEIDPILKQFDFSKFNWYLLITPDKFSWINQLFIVKFIELFWRKIARDVFSYEQIKHAITVIPNKDELCITFWEWELLYEGNILNIPLPKNSNIWTIMSIWYYLIWKIQNSYPQYFKKNIWNYINSINKTEFWKNVKVIVE